MKMSIPLVLLMITSQVFGQTVISTNYKDRMSLYKLGFDFKYEGDIKTAMSYFKKLAETDSDTFLVAAKAYGYMALIYKYDLEDSISCKAAEDIQINYINRSIEKYPDNKDAYIDRLRIYKFSKNKTGEEEFIKFLSTKFFDNWEVNFALGYHYIYTDFLWPDSKEFNVSSNYFKRVLELNPSDFNTLLLLSVAYEKNRDERMSYLKRMYQIAPQQFVKNQSESKNKYPYQIQSVASVNLGLDLFAVISKEESLALKLIK